MRRVAVAWRLWGEGRSHFHCRKKEKIVSFGICVAQL